nr:phosphoenolpyruvate carboxylase [Aeromonas sp.]
MNEKYAALRANVGMLGQLLGKSIKDHQGQAFLDKIETIRQLAKSSRKGNEADRERLLDTLRTLSDDELLPVARAFSQFLNLANVAEQFHTISRRCEEQVCTPDPLEQMFDKLKASNLSQEAIIQAVRELDIDLVLTAHPTEVTRRTLIHKHVQLNDCLEALELSDLLPRERDKIQSRIEQLVNQAWHTNEIREQRPTPVDEAKWGFAVVENSLWPAIPEFMRNLDERLQHHLGVRLPLDAAPVKFTSWMGGDRDGNPFVTAKVTAEVLELGRWMAVSLFYKDIKELTSELSMADCTDAVRA